VGRQAAAVGVRHPSPEQIEAVAHGWLVGPAAQQLRAHAAACLRCGPRLAAEDQLHRQLALLRRGEPRVDVVAAVLDQVLARPVMQPRATRAHPTQLAASAVQRLP
jgi:anti-sigma factor ChrR (cupin superfamily)